MAQTRYFTRVYTADRRPLSHKPFLAALDEVIIGDAITFVRFALDAREHKPNGLAVPGQTQKDNYEV